MADLLFWCRPCASEPPSINRADALPTSRFLAFLGYAAASISFLSLARNLRYMMTAAVLSFEEKGRFLPLSPELYNYVIPISLLSRSSIFLRHATNLGKLFDHALSMKKFSSR